MWKIAFCGLHTSGVCANDVDDKATTHVCVYTVHEFMAHYVLIISLSNYTLGLVTCFNMQSREFCICKNAQLITIRSASTSFT